jgi:hypothetical protein
MHGLDPHRAARRRLVLSAISYAFTPRPRPGKAAATTLDEFSVPTAEDGRPIPAGFGTVLIRGENLVWAINRESDE